MCKLLNTVGGKLDATVKVEYRDRMKVYFERMKRLTENQSLESRIRFMVQVRRLGCRRGVERGRGRRGTGFVGTMRVM